MFHLRTTIVAICWIAWAVVWAGGWLYTIARGPRTRRASVGWSSAAAIAAALILTDRAFRNHDLLLVRGAPAAWVGAVLLMCGTAFTLWARVVLGRMWSSAPSVKEGHELHTGGPYAVTRHPIYTGMLAMALGTVFMDGHLRVVVGALAFLAYILVKVRTEERLMLDTFGERYVAYRKRTPQLIPGVRRSPARP